MVINVIKTVGKFLAAALFLVGSSNAWSGHVSSEKLLDPGYYKGTPFHMPKEPRIDMTNVSLNYNKHQESLTGFSKSSSKLTLYTPSLVAKTFKGVFALDADISPGGTFTGGAFTFFSNDPYFGFGKNKWGNVFSGELTAAGWSASKNVIEFATGNFSGWACDQGWCTDAERLWFTNVDGFPDAGWTRNWSDNNVNGTAVIPVPAAAWLLGSGLLGLVGVAKRKKA